MLTESVVVVGASGFVGSRVAARLAMGGARLVRMQAPRLETMAREAQGLARESEHCASVQGLSDAFLGSSTIVLAAGMASPTAKDSNVLYGANALLPLVVERAAAQLGASLLIHVGSAAVQGRLERLDESDETQPTTPYARSKAVAEQGLRLTNRLETTVVRATSVHGLGRALTARLFALARSGSAVVAGSGARPTPQVHVESLAELVEVVHKTKLKRPQIVLTPWEGFTCAGFLRMLGGREPVHVPAFVAHLGIQSAQRLGTAIPSVDAFARRAEMMLLGQEQVSGWVRDNDLEVGKSMGRWDLLVTGLRSTGRGSTTT